MSGRRGARKAVLQNIAARTRWGCRVQEVVLGAMVPLMMAMPRGAPAIKSGSVRLR